MRHAGWLIVLALAVGLAGCDAGEFTGLDRIDQWATEAADAFQVAQAECDVALMLVAESQQCKAFNPYGTEASFDGFPAVIWSVDDASVATIDMGGVLTAHAIGTVIVTAQGEGSTTASDTVTVQ